MGEQRNTMRDILIGDGRHFTWLSLAKVRPGHGLAADYPQQCSTILFMAAFSYPLKTRDICQHSFSAMHCRAGRYHGVFLHCAVRICRHLGSHIWLPHEQHSSGVREQLGPKERCFFPTPQLSAGHCRTAHFRLHGHILQKAPAES